MHAIFFVNDHFSTLFRFNQLCCRRAYSRNNWRLFYEVQNFKFWGESIRVNEDMEGTEILVGVFGRWVV